MATATGSTEPPPPRYFGPCLVAPLVLHAQQPEPAAWVPPREWNPATAGWDPRITYRGLSADAKASLTEEYLLFEVSGHADDDPEDPAVQQGKGHVLCWLPCRRSFAAWDARTSSATRCALQRARPRAWATRPRAPRASTSQPSSRWVGGNRCSVMKF